MPCIVHIALGHVHGVWQRTRVGVCAQHPRREVSTNIWLCCAIVLCRAVLCRAMLCYAVPCCAMPCHAVLCRAVLLHWCGNAGVCQIPTTTVSPAWDGTTFTT